MEGVVNVKERFKHKPLDLNKNQVRLFRLTKARPGRSLRGEIRIFDFKDCPEYAVVSYTWGPPLPTLDILLNGRNFSVRENLWQFMTTAVKKPSILPHIPRYREDRLRLWLWIDQICIDQSAVEERNHQVGLMADIFARAVQVIVWLGSEADGSSDAMKAVELCLPMKERHGTGLWEYEYEGEIQKLFRRPYWGRLWVLQEIFMGRDILVFCGEKGFSWSTFEAIFTPKGKLADLYKWECPIEINEAILALIKEKAIFEHPNHRLTYILETFSGCGCEDVRDKVFGLLSLVRQCGQVTIDYSKTPSEVYFATIRAMIVDEQSTEIDAPFRVARLLRNRMNLTEVSDVDIFDYVEQRLLLLGRDSHQKHLQIKDAGGDLTRISYGLFPDRNLDTSQPSISRDLAPPLLRLAQARLSFGSCLLRSAHPFYQTSSNFNEGPEKAPFPSQGSQICSHCAFTTCASQILFPNNSPRLPVYM